MDKLEQEDQDSSENFKTIYEIKLWQQQPPVEKSFIITSERLKQIEDSVLKKNQLAMKYLNKGNKVDAINLLREAESLLFDEHSKDRYNIQINRLIGITLNNLGCYFQKDEKPQVALKYLQKALEIETITQNDFSTLSGTHLNICAILSSLDKHQEAVKHANAALHFVQKAKGEIISDQNQSDIQQSENESTRLLQQLKTQVIDLAISLQKSSYNIYTTEIVSYYNLGIEYQYLKEYTKSLQMLKAGYQIAQNHFGDKNPLSVKMDDAIKKAESMIKVRVNKTPKRFVKHSISSRMDDQQIQTNLIYSDYSYTATNLLQQGHSTICNSSIDVSNQKKNRENIQLKELSLQLKDVTITEASTTRKIKRNTTNSVWQNQNTKRKSQFKLPTLNTSTIEQPTTYNESTFSRTPNAKSTIGNISSISSVTPNTNVRSRSTANFSSTEANKENKIKRSQQLFDMENNIDIKKEGAVLDDQIQETIFAQIVRKKQQMSGAAVNESQKQWNLSSMDKVDSGKNQQLLTQIFQNMEDRNNKYYTKMNETRDEWKDKYNNHYKTKTEFSPPPPPVPINQTPINRQQRSLSQNPRNRNQRLKTEPQSSTLNPISNNQSFQDKRQNNNSKSPNHQPATQSFVQLEINTLKLKENIQQIRKKINSTYSYHRNSEEDVTSEKGKTLSPKQINRGGRNGVRRIKFSTITPSPVSRRIKADIKNECIQEEDDQIQESISVKKRI